MTVGIIVNFPYHTGAGRYAFELFNHLKNKIDVELVYCNNDEKVNTTKVRNIRGINFPVFRKTLNSYFYYPSKIPEYDLYHPTNHFIARVAKFRQPCIVSVLDLFFLKSKTSAPFLTQFLVNRSLKFLSNTEKIITISNDTKRDLINLLGIDEEKIKVIYLGVDLDSFKRKDKNKSRENLKIPQKNNIILNIGPDADTRKNIETVIKVFYEVQKVCPEAILIRIGKMSENITNLIEKLGIKNKIIRIERVGERDLPSYYTASDVYMCLDLETGFGLPLLESMACGTPVVCSNGGAFPEVVGDSGLMIDPLDIKQISKSVLNVLRNDDLRINLVKSGLKRSREFSWEKCARETLKVYKEVL